MFQYAADGIQCVLRNPGIFVPCKKRLSLFPYTDMGMHSGSIILKKGLWHEGNSVAVATGHVFEYIFEPGQLIPHLKQGFETHINFCLACGCHLVMLALNIYSQFFKSEEHFCPHVLVFVHGRKRKISFLVPGFISEIGAFIPAAVPYSFFRVNHIGSTVC